MYIVLFFCRYSSSRPTDTCPNFRLYLMVPGNLYFSLQPTSTSATVEVAEGCYFRVSNPLLNLNGSQSARSAVWSGELQCPIRKLRVSRWKDCDQGRPWWLFGFLLQGQRPSERGQPFLVHPRLSSERPCM